MKTVAHFVETFVPENYNLFLDINRAEKTFTGNVAINGEALDNTISLHQKDLTIKSILLDNAALPFHMDDENEAVHIDLPITGTMTLLVEFAGQITDNMSGIYPSYYTVDGVKKEVISTQFESHFARQAFPCIDEPEAKATFDFSVKFDQVDGEIALSNMPENNRELREETGIWTFETTPRMSSYLLAFGLGDLQGKTAQTKNGTEVGVFATRAHAPESLDFALDIATRVIDFYEDYFQVKYPIAQCYHLALPDFSSGAMENWGLVTYREIYLLVDENSSLSSRQQVALVIAHEVAHQWFGNLVTMKWWDDLWLNESFANMMEYVSVDTINPELNIFEDFQTGGVPAALKRDATDGVQSVHVAVNHPDEINTLFDPAIVYAKGSRLMHMLRRWLGDEAFAAGLKIYFEKHQYGNTVGRDLWLALAETSGRDVASFMDSWLEQPGYPLVTAKVIDDQLVLSQKQFFIGEHEDKNRLWTVPLNASWTGLPDVLDQAEIIIPNFSQLQADNEGPLLLNTQNTAHYLTDYQGTLLTDILENWTSLDNTTKLQVLQERRLLAESGQISYADLVELLPNLTEETSNLVTLGISDILSALKRFIEEGSQTEEDFKSIIRWLFQANYDRLGFEKRAGEADEDELVRQTSLAYLLEAGHEAASEQAQAIFQDYADRIDSLPAAIRGLVLTNQVRVAESDTLVDQFIAAYRMTNDSNFRRQLAQALTKTKSSQTLDKLLKGFKDKDFVKPQDLSMWYSLLLGQAFAQETTWTWARENWDWIKSSLGGDMSFDKFVIIPAAIFKTPERLTEYKAFFEPLLEDMALSRNISMGIKDIAARVELIERERSAIAQAIEAIRP
ncbi:M1 family metallopeptidase [Streptococcus caprae]|uniref:Aminopeptidase n=1 Tax=Streptococcus caprae TaxID=1640501 RepID=A0ABV8CY91_9STRE